jgi:acetyl/propionyl-CoA carboxylase alpha subunit
MSAALREFEILGLRHNIPFLAALLSRPEVRSLGGADTTFIDRHLAELSPRPAAEVVRAAAALAAVVAAGSGVPRRSGHQHGRDPWDTLGAIDW